MKKTLFGVSLLSGIGLVTFLNFGTIKADNHSLGSIMRYLHSKNPQYSLKLFQKLNQYQLLSQSQSTKNIFVGSGIDIEGRLTEGLSKAGFFGEQIGPISLQASTKQQKITHLGLNYARSKLISYKLNNPSKQFIIGFNILPDYQILKVAPYLLKQNIINQFQAIQPNLNAIDFITVNLAHQNVQKYMGNYLCENETLLIDIFSSISKKVQKNQTENRCEVYLQTQKPINLELYKKITHQNNKYKHLHKSSWQQIFNALYNTK